MARGSAGKSGGMSRIRFVMVDAEIPDGEMGSVTQAIQNALRGPTPIIVQRLSAPAKNGTTHEADGEELDEAEMLDAEQDVEAGAAPRQPRARRTLKAPKAVPIEMNEEVSLATFAQGKDVGSQWKKYLVASAWLKEHRGIDAVTDGHIYTCFKAMDWSTNIRDFAQPLRDMKTKSQYYDKTDKGYEINHLGLDYVKKLIGKA
jgi:hypothetical protein